MLSEIDTLPEGLLERPADRLHEVLPGPTLLHLAGREQAPLFVSVLLHGNEDTGWEALRGLLRDYRGRPLPRALSLFIGNVAAARTAARHLPGQPDYNRIWNGGESAEQRMVRQVIESMRRRRVFASIDIHNNTGRNPHYACVNRLDSAFLHLATLFNRTVVYFIRPDSVQSMAFSRVCPSVTVECGKPGQRQGVDHAREFVDALLHLREFPLHPPAPGDCDIFHTVATVKVPPDVGFSFDGRETDLMFSADLDQLNFRELPAGTVFARTWSETAHLEVLDERGESVGGDYFAVLDGELHTCVPVMPSMLTMEPEVVRQDCLCYLMERIRLAT